MKQENKKVNEIIQGINAEYFVDEEKLLELEMRKINFRRGGIGPY